MRFVASALLALGLVGAGQAAWSQSSRPPKSGSGTVSSVALTAPTFLAVGGSPVTTTGTLALTLATQTANTVFAGPTTGAATAPTFRALVNADIATLNLALSQITGLGTGVATALAINVGSAGAPVVFNGAGGTPSSITLTNATGLPAASVLSGALVNGMTATTQTVGDNTTKVATTAFVLANASGSTGANPSATAGPTAVNGSATTFMRSDAAPAVQKSAASTFGIMEPDGQSVVCVSGVCSTSVPTRTVTTSPTVTATDMGGVIYSNVSGGGTYTIPAISGTVFAAGMSSQVTNYSASTEAVSTTPTVNAGGGCVTATGVPSGDTWYLTSNGTTLDCVQSVPSASSGVSSVTNSDSTLTISPTTGAVVASLNVGHANVWTAQQSQTITALTISTATFTPTGASNDYSFTLVHASCPCTLANPSATPVPGTHGVIFVAQSATGSDTIGTWGSDYQAPGGTSTITLSTGASAQDALAYVVLTTGKILLLPALNFSH